MFSRACDVSDMFMSQLDQVIDCELHPASIVGDHSGQPRLPFSAIDQHGWESFLDAETDKRIFTRYSAEDQPVDAPCDQSCDEVLLNLFLTTHIRNDGRVSLR